MSNAEEYYHAAYDVHSEQIISLKDQIKLLNEVLEIDSLQKDLKQAIASGDKIRIQLAKDKYKEANKARDKIARKLIFWKTLAIGEGIALVVITGVGLVLVYL